MHKIRIKKGHDVRMKGIPSDEISSEILPEKVSLSPQQFRGIKPKLLEWSMYVMVVERLIWEK